MRVLPGNLRAIFYSALLGGFVWAWTSGTGLAGQEQPAQPEKTPTKPEGDKTDKNGDKTYAFEMRDKPWGFVLEWLAEKTGVMVITDEKPKGTFTFIPAKGKTYTINEIIDIINEGLSAQNFILIRREQSFTLITANDKIPAHLCPRISMEELPKRAKTEIVQLVYPLVSLMAEDFAPEVQKLMGPFGSVVSLSTANQLVMQDSVKNLGRIVDTIKSIEESGKDQHDQLTYKCKFIKAREAERILKELMPNPAVEQLRQNPPNLARGFQGEMMQLNFPIQGGGPGGRNPQGQQQGNTPKVRMHYITADDRTNSVLVSGPANKISQAKKFLEQIDVGQPGQRARDNGSPELRSYAVPAGSADAMAKALQAIHKETSILRIWVSGNNKITVYGTPDDQGVIAGQIKSGTEKGTTTEFITLNALEAPKVMEWLKGMFIGDAKTGVPYIDVDTGRNAVIVRGSPEQVAEIQTAINILGESGGTTGNMRIISMDKGNAAAMAEALKRLIPQVRQNPVIVNPGQETKPSEPKTMEKSKDGDSEEEEDQEVQETPSEPQDNQDTKNSQPKKDGSQEKPINITAVGNRLIITSDDPAALDEVQRLARLLMQSPTEQGAFEIIRLKHANATDLAKVIDEAFNGQRTPANQRDAGFPFPFGRGATPAPATTATPAVRVVADPSTNSLLIKASPLDMATIRNWLENALDTGLTESTALARTWVIGPLKFANATDVANVIRDVFREQMNNNPVATNARSVGGIGNLFGRTNLNVDAIGNPRGVSLSVGVDDRTNSLVVMCSQSMHEDVENLAKTLDEAARDASKTVRIISSKNVDPIMLQQAMDAISGRRTNQPRGGATGFNPAGGTGFMPGMTPFGRGGQGGFNPGGGAMQPGGVIAVPGGNVGPGGGNRGGGGQQGNRGGGGGGNRQGQNRNRGLGFFAHRVKDDPRQSLYYNPPDEKSASESITVDFHARGKAKSASSAPGEKALSQPGSSNQLTQLQNPQPPAQPPTPSDAIRARLQTTVEALEQLGLIVITGNNQADVEEVLKIIEIIRKEAKGAEFQFRLVPLFQADATSVANTLNQLFSRVQIGTNANYPARSAAAPTQVGQQTAANFAATSSVVLLPITRFNAILVAAPEARLDDVEKEIKLLDRPSGPLGKAVYFQLSKSSSSRVATLLNNFFATRYPENQMQNQIRITQDESTNTIIVQAAPADLTEIKDLIDQIESTISKAVNDIRIVDLRNVPSDEMATLLQQAISQAVAPQSAQTPVTPGAAPVFPPTTQQIPGVQSPTTTPGQPAAPTKSTTLRFVTSAGQGVKRVVEAGLLDDIRITSNARLNRLIISAPEKSMDLIMALVRDLDALPSLKAEISIFQLKRADAASMAQLLLQIFTGASSGTAPGAAAPPGGPGFQGPQQPGAAPATSARQLSPLTVTGTPQEGGPLVDLRFSIDPRTNSLIVAGSRSDLEVIEALISRLEDADILARQTEVYHIRNTSASAVDLANTINSYLANLRSVYQVGDQATPFQQIEREVVIVPEPISNKLLISSTPRYYHEVMRIIHELDADTPQVVIQALVAEVDLTGTEEFGVEIGLQSPVLFQRSIIPAPGFLGTGLISYINPGLVPPGVTVNSTINPAALPGFGFNSTGPLGNNPVVSPSVVGYQGLGNLGVGRVSPTSNVGGFVFSAGSDAFNLLIRALKTQGRMDILSRPQIMTLDNQSSRILVGQNVPYVSGTDVTATGIIVNNVLYRDVGVQLSVTPRISPDGKVVMRVIPEISSVAESQVALGNGVLASAFNVQSVETTVVAQDGETIAIGGLISKRDLKRENKIPWFGDLPGVGSLFRFRTQAKAKTELLVILTPHVVRTQWERERILSMEAKRMDWVLGDVLKMHGPHGLDALKPPSPQGCAQPSMTAPPGPGQEIPFGPNLTQPAPVEQVPAPRPYTPEKPPGMTPGPPIINPPNGPNQPTQPNSAGARFSPGSQPGMPAPGGTNVNGSPTLPGYPNQVNQPAGTLGNTQHQQTSYPVTVPPNSNFNTPPYPQGTSGPTQKRTEKSKWDLLKKWISGDETW